MAKQKKIMDINEGHTHLVVIRMSNQKDPNPYRIYLVISCVGAPVRKRLLDKYADFMSVLYFIRNFYLEGIDALCYTDMVRWIRRGYGYDA